MPLRKPMKEEATQHNRSAKLAQRMAEATEGIAGSINSGEPAYVTAAKQRGYDALLLQRTAIQQQQQREQEFAISTEEAPKSKHRESEKPAK